MQDRPDWGGGKLNATTLLLKPLGRRDCDLLIDQLAGELPAAARAEVIAASEGNPLYLEEMVALISERGAVGVPGTIHALLAQRLDGLPSEERELLELGAVEGEVFHRKSVSALAGDAPAIDTTLEALLRKQLIRPHEAILEGDDAFRFHHLLLRDAAYATLGKSRRVGLHERFATWLESLTPEPLQRDELVGWHLEQAVRFRGELGDESESKLRRRAATHLHKAGRRAARRGDVVAAVNLYERAVRLVDGRDAFTALVNVELAGELLWAGELTRAGELLAAWEREPEVAALAAVTRFEWLIRVRPEDAVAVIESELPAVIEALERDGNEQGIARAHMAAHQALNFRCCWAAAAEQARLAVEHAGRAGDSDLRWRALAMYFGALVRGPQHADVLAAQLDKIEREERDPDVFVLQSVRINNIRSQLAGLEGRLADARDLSQRATDAARALGLPELLAACDSFRAFMELDAGEPEAALEALLRCDANLAARNDRGNRSSIQAMLAHTYELLGDSDSALAALQWLDELGSPEVFNDVVKQRVRGRLALAAGRRAGAERCARAAVEEALRSDWPTLQADARLDLARVLSALGRHEQASAEAGAALELFEGKGSVPGAARARALLGALATV
jgi:tetratricopeptide (TPR) repeat protein